jgi:hypothetical protein
MNCKYFDTAPATVTLIKAPQPNLLPRLSAPVLCIRILSFDTVRPAKHLMIKSISVPSSQSPYLQTEICEMFPGPQPAGSSQPLEEARRRTAAKLMSKLCNSWSNHPSDAGDKSQEMYNTSVIKDLSASPLWGTVLLRGYVKTWTLPSPRISASIIHRIGSHCNVASNRAVT